VARRGIFRRIIDLFRTEDVTSRRTPGERAFGRGKRVSAKDAERYAQRARDARATRNATAARRRAEQRREREAGERRFKEAWQEETLSRPARKYARHYELFQSIPDIDQETPEEQEYLWRSYIENMVSGRHRRNDPNNPFWSDIGLDPRNFDWDEFRTAQGYKSRR
jgi:hypothetical protein